MTAVDLFWELHGASVTRKTLVRIAMSQFFRSLLQEISPQHDAQNQQHDLHHDLHLNGWIMGPPNKDNLWCVFVFGFLRNVLLPPESLSVHSVMCGALALGDLVAGSRCSKHRSLFEIAGHHDRQAWQIVAMHSKLLQLQDGQDGDDENNLSFSQVCAYVARYRDVLDASDAQVWSEHVFLPHDSMLPSFLVDLPPP